MIPENIAQKLIRGHLVEGEMTPGAPIELRIGQTLTQDATGGLIERWRKATTSCLVQSKDLICTMHGLTKKQIAVILEGGLINWSRKGLASES